MESRQNRGASNTCGWNFEDFGRFLTSTLDFDDSSRPSLLEQCKIVVVLRESLDNKVCRTLYKFSGKVSCEEVRNSIHSPI